MLTKKYREQDWNNVGYETACNTKREMVKSSAVDFYDDVEALKGEQPFDKQTEAYEAWRQKFNKRMAYYNGIIGYRAYKLV